MQSAFIHLHVHSEYSLVDGIVSVDKLIARCVEMKMPAVALTDLNNLFAAVKFYKAAMDAGIKPILGADCLIKNSKDLAKPFKALLLCQNNLGYKNLTKLISRGYLEGQHHGQVQLEQSWFEELNQGLILIIGINSDVGHALLMQDNKLALDYLYFWKTYFHDRLYLELQRIGLPDEDNYTQAVLQLSINEKLPVVATNAVRFINADDFDAHEARVCINRGDVLMDEKRPHDYTEQQYLRSPEAMLSLFSDLPPAIENSIEIAKRCNLSLELGKYYLPDFPVPGNMTLAEYFIQQAKQGLEKRYTYLFNRQDSDFPEQKKMYDERLQIELNVINSMGFAGYFMIVADFIQWAKKNNIAVGPGRGSGAGSLVAFALEITDLDPLQYDLLFERFLNPERISMPDFDIDFCMDGRDRVIEYVAEKYGRESVSQIITFGTMAAKAVIRDVGRVLSHPYGFVDKIAKLIPFELGITLERALAQEPLLLDRYNQEEEVRDLIDLAQKLEGIARNAGKHAGGVVIAPTALTDFCPLYCEEGSNQIVTQFDKDDVETIGLVKFDFLGLRTLTIIDWAVRAVNEKRARRNEEPINITTLPVNDAKTFELLKSCKTTAIFQLESRGMKDLIKRLQPDCFEDIIALVALFRPGPLQSGMVDDFIDRKHGRATVMYLHPDLEPVLSTTYGVILYQEQVMQIAQVLAGYTLGEADLLRRAMGKKKPEEMAKQRKIFMEGALKKGVDADTATSIFDLMEKFAGYGFNKSHSAAYALLSYQTAWLKAHYPSEFMAAVLSSDMDKTDKVVVFIEETRQLNIPLLPPDINSSFCQFKVNADDAILYGLGSIKGAGIAVLQSIIQEREARGPFKDLFDFCERIDLKKANRRLLEALIKSGAFDVFNVDRNVLFSSLDLALKQAQQVEKNRTSGQLDIFSVITLDKPSMTYVDVPDWPDEIRLQGEKETLGFYWSGHPLDRYRSELDAFTTGRICDLNPNYDQAVIIAGTILNIRFLQTRRGDRMAFLGVDDGTGQIEIAVFSDLLETTRHLIAKDQIIVIEGEVSIDDYSGGYRMSCKNILSLDEARARYSRSIELVVLQQQLNETFMEKLYATLTAFCQGSCPVILQYQTATSTAKIQLGQSWSVHPRNHLLENLQALMGKENVLVNYS